MALPTILVNSATGSDTAASGAGPTTALTGTQAASNAGGTVIDLSLDAPDLSGVATDGSAVLWFSHSAGRNFAKISATDNGAKTVTVANAVTGSLSGKTWAIGGKRASVWSTSTRKLFSADALPGWIIEMQSGHTESISASCLFSTSGNTTDGPITLRGEAGAATLPIITSTHNDVGMQFECNYFALMDFEVRNTNGTKTASYGISFWSGGLGCLVSGIKCSHATNYFYRGIYCRSTMAAGTVIKDCEVGYCANVGVSANNNAANGAVAILGLNVHHCGSHGLEVLSYGDANLTIDTVLSWANGGDGIRIPSLSTVSSISISRSTINGNTGDGIDVANSSSSLLGLKVYNTIISNNGGYGINFNSAAIGALNGNNVRVFNCGTYNNTSGAFSTTGIDVNCITTDPGFADAANGDFSVGTNMKAYGWPTQNIGNVP